MTPRMLIVEDADVTTSALARYCKDWGFQVEACRSIEDAREVVSKPEGESIFVAILSLRTLRKLRAEPAEPEEQCAPAPPLPQSGALAPTRVTVPCSESPACGRATRHPNIHPSCSCVMPLRSQWRDARGGAQYSCGRRHGPWRWGLAPST
jgi:hypothetical protein